MVEVYYKLIKFGRKTIDQVPENLREAVQEMLNNEIAN
jgi:hypothetical protein